MSQDRKCKGCGVPLSGHPNKRFCTQRCKDRYHNTTNPRGIGARHERGSYAEYAETIHPFSSESFDE